MTDRSLDPAVKTLLTGHTKLAPFTHGDTRETVCADPADVPRLREAQRLRGHLRDVFTRTGACPDGAAPVAVTCRRKRQPSGGTMATDSKRKREPSGLPFVVCADSNFCSYSTMRTRLARG